MSFGGHVMDMVRRMNYNRALLEARRERTANLKHNIYSGAQYKRKAAPERKIPREKLKRIVRKIHINKKLQREAFTRKTFVAMMAVAFAIFVLVMILTQ
ncbi:MAG: hypothetical protein GC178_09100 [Flavobacteriales bacterium]|nr:hypothetical protein [Flavobacteriales bacterium]